MIRATPWSMIVGMTVRSVRRFIAANFTIALLALGACAALPGADAAPPAAQIRALLDAQQLGWNRGDLDAFMQGYWHSEQLRFDSGATTFYGWQATYDRYRRRYPDSTAMGKLVFTNLAIVPLDADNASVTGEWRLERGGDLPHGTFTLELRRLKEGWKIVHDRTEVAG